MNPIQSPRQTHIHLSEEEAEQLKHPSTEDYTVEVQPPRHRDPSATLPEFIRGITEFQTRILNLGNASPTTVYEIRRKPGGDIQLLYTVPTKRLERKLRTQLSNSIPEIGFNTGTTGLPVYKDTELGGGLLTLGRPDYFPLRTEFQNPPINALVSSLHRHALQDTGIVVQLLFTPLIGQPLRNRWWKRKAYRRRNYLRKEKEKLWGSRTPTKRERRQAQNVDNKAGNARFTTAVRFLFTGSGKYTPSRVKELAGAFNTYENPETGQYLNAVTLRSLRRTPIIHFAEAVANREPRAWTRSFRTTVDELAALTSVPSLEQDNLNYSQ
jgi:hypothetical protein